MWTTTHGRGSTPQPEDACRRGARFCSRAGRREDREVRDDDDAALRLKCLSTEAFWYFFKLLVFGSADPGEHPGLASMAMAMALEARGSFMIAYVMAAMLRADFSRQLWGKVLEMARRHVQENAAVFDEYPDDFKARPW